MEMLPVKESIHAASGGVGIVSASPVLTVFRKYGSGRYP
jgi:hypothetical protein